MAESWERDLDRWLAASLIDRDTADRIRAHERAQSPGSGLRWPVTLAIALGVVTLAAGILLFVSAHWDELSPAARMALVVTLAAGFHVGGAFTAGRFSSLSIGLHALGTAALGAGIALTGQIFHLQAHWPGGILLWAIGAALAWWLLRQWPQYAITALLAPAWLVGEWSLLMEGRDNADPGSMIVFVFLTLVTYLASNRLALSWIGGIGLLPMSSALWFGRSRHELSWDTLDIAGWILAIGLPLGLAFLLRGRAAIYHLVAPFWAVCAYYNHEKLINYPWFALGSVALIAWGAAERHSGRINLGMAGFAATVLAFYFSHVMDKLGRSASLIALGTLFLGGGWLLERTRRRLVARVRP